MIISMMCTSGLPKFLRGEALKITNYLTNRIPSKVVAKILFETKKNRKPSIQHVHVWGCRVEARPYNPKESKLDSKIVSGFFIGYPDHSRVTNFIALHILPESLKPTNQCFLMR